LGHGCCGSHRSNIHLLKEKRVARDFGLTGLLRGIGWSARLGFIADRERDEMRRKGNGIWW
jgi:hypothetical protein